jgi:hypothetical protein
MKKVWVIPVKNVSRRRTAPRNQPGSNPLNNPDLLFRHPIKLVDLGVYLAIGGLYVYGRLFCLQEEFALAANAKRVIWGSGGGPELNGILEDDILVGLGKTLFVVDIPPPGPFRFGLGYIIIL